MPEPENDGEEPEFLNTKEVRTIAHILKRQEATKFRGIEIIGAKSKYERVENLIEQIHKDFKGVVFSKKIFQTRRFEEIMGMQQFR